MKKALVAVPLLILVQAYAVHAQYSFETVLEKTFETSGIFFRPAAVNPYGLGTFGSVAPGLIDDPLLNLQLNPAFSAAGSALAGYTYLNFRNSKDVEHTDSYIYPCWDRVYFAPYPCGSGSSGEPEPIVTAALFLRPLRVGRSPLTLGVTYEAILQDGAYQQVSGDIYRSNPGEDFAGNKTAEIAETDITDRYSGRDDMHTEGHFLTLYAGLPVSRRLNLGIKAGIVTYLRDGGLGNTYQWDNGMFEDEVSRYEANTARNQEYRHTDIEAGLQFTPTQETSLGFSAGIIRGDVDQDLMTTNASLYRYGVVDQTVDWSYYSQEGSTGQSWAHTGGYAYGTVSLQHLLSDDKQLVCYYRAGRQDVDIDLVSAIADSSESDYQYESSTWTSSSWSANHLYDTRTGSGSKDGWVHQGAAYLRWQTGPGTEVDFGLNVLHSAMRTATSESVLADRYSEYESEGDSWYHHYINSVVEDKELRWNFHSTVTTVQIPVILRHRINEKHEFMFGISRRMSRWRLTDETLALFSFREENRNGDLSKKEHFGERYTMPAEIESTVTTSIIAGYTISPSDHLKIRALTMPRFEKTWNGTVLSNFQWWIDFQLFY
ncbi:hypothetical protein JXO52_07220 [bacterium]|nr:hypothetical protein [bacterium]